MAPPTPSTPPPPNPVVPQPTCLSCGYVLIGLPGPLCPECGRPFSLKHPTTYRLPGPRPPDPLRRPFTHLGCLLIINGSVGVAIAVAGWVAMSRAGAAGITLIKGPFGLICPAISLVVLVTGIVTLFVARRR